MNVLILGSGGREHAYAAKISQSKQCNKLIVAPGNAGTAEIATNISLNINDFEEVKKVVLSEEIDLVIVGPEEPLVRGIVDFFQSDDQLSNKKILGPDKVGAQLEGSKDFSKEFMNKYGIPTAASKTFTVDTIASGFEFLETLSPPYVLKADGLAAGKGVIITEDINEARSTLKDMLENQKFGTASNKVLIEEFLDGIELSVFVLSDSKNYLILPEAKDYKRIGEHDTGLNTGGMGAVSPVPFASEDFMKKVEDSIIIPTITGLQKEEIVYKGFIFLGLIKVGEDPYVIEYNVRMGDPETEAVFPRIKSDLLPLLKGAVDGTLNQLNIEINPDYAVTTMVVSGGYPEDFEKGKEMEIPIPDENGYIYHAGTLKSGDKTLSNGGRVIALTGVDKTLELALKKSQDLANKVKFENRYFRKDIGADLKQYL